MSTLGQSKPYMSIKVILNGEIGEPYRATRGVRQGDPLLLLLFNLEIESLAQMLRNSDLWGFKTEDDIERLIATLFANNTMVYLSKDNDLASFQDILTRWCDASKAKFNTPNMVVIPVGLLTFYKNLIAT